MSNGMSRLYDDTPLPAAKPVLMEFAKQHTSQIRPGDYAQAVMDLGATICTPKNPACGICPVHSTCKSTIRLAHRATCPKKTPKKAETNATVSPILRDDDGAWLLETRPDKGLLYASAG
jgi:A/G-specific adenine glycosylase